MKFQSANLADGTLLAKLKEEHARLSRLAQRLMSGKCWTRDQPGRATKEETLAQINEVRRALAELERSVGVHTTV
jgi:hypothetical protein